MINQEKKVSWAAPHFERESSSPLKSPVSKPPTLQELNMMMKFWQTMQKNEVIAFLFFFFFF